MSNEKRILHISVRTGGKTEYKTVIIVDKEKSFSSIISDFENILLNNGIKKNGI